MLGKVAHVNQHGYTEYLDSDLLPLRDCACTKCLRAAQAKSGARRKKGGWTPRTVGTTESGETVTFRQGLGNNTDHTLITDGDKSDREFRRGHNHYGPRREGDGRVDDDRGYYTGPGH